MSYWPFGTEADIGQRVYGSSIEQIFRDHHAGMMSILIDKNIKSNEINETFSSEFSLSMPIYESGENYDLLLVMFLEEVLFKLEVDDQWIYDVKLRIKEVDDFSVCEGIFYYIPKELASIEVEIKAITSHMLNITKVKENEEIVPEMPDIPSFTGPGYYSDVVFDI